MPHKKPSPESIRQAWHSATDQALAHALINDLDTYPPEVQTIIRQEVQSRDLSAEIARARLSKPAKISREIYKNLKTLTLIIVIFLSFLFLAAMILTPYIHSIKEQKAQSYHSEVVGCTFKSTQILSTHHAAKSQ